MATPTQELADWAVGLSLNDVPEDVQEDAKLRVLDTLGCALAAMETDVSLAAREAATRLESGGSGSRVIGYGDSFSAPTAAFVNGTMAHALDYDDTHLEGNNHVSAPAVTTAVAVGDAGGVSGRQFLLGVITGRESSCRVGVVTPGTLIDQGFHPTSVIGTLTSALLAGQLQGLDAGQMVNAMGIAGSQAAGILQAVKDGTWTKRLQPGWAAHSAVWAAALAKQGVTGPAEILEGEFGIFRTHAPSGTYDFGRVTQGLGQEWLSRTVNYKPYPCGQVVHPFIDAALRVREQHRIRPEEVKAVRCPIFEDFVPIVCEPATNKLRPESGYHAKFSLYYAVAVALAFGEVTPTAYTEAAVRQEHVLELAQRVSYEIDATPPGLTDRRGWVIVETVDGRTHEVVVDEPLGTAANPFTPDHVRAKFEQNVSAFLSSGQIDAVYKRLERLQDMPDVREIISAFITKQ